MKKTLKLGRLGRLMEADGLNQMVRLSWLLVPDGKLKIEEVNAFINLTSTTVQTVQLTRDEPDGSEFQSWASGQISGMSQRSGQSGSEKFEVSRKSWKSLRNES